MKTRAEIIADHPIEQVLADRGVELKGGGTERKAKCPFHTDKTPSFLVNTKKQLWHCPACKLGGSVIDLLAQFEGTTAIGILKKYGGSTDSPAPAARKSRSPHFHNTTNSGKKATAPEPDKEPAKESELAATYDYRNAAGVLVYQALRFQTLNPEKLSGYDKTFRQRRPDPNNEDKWLWNMENVERVLYQLPKILKTSKPVWICEGEKDADNLTRLGFIATCNVGGAGKWMEAYANTFKEREVVLCGDNDKPGQEHMDAVMKSLEGKVKSVRTVVIPQPHKDVSDYLATFFTDEQMFDAVNALFVEAIPVERGVNIQVYSMEEAEHEYMRSLAVSESRSLDFSKWLPSLGSTVRPMVGGEVVAIIAGTAVGKTATAQNILLHAAPLKSILFEQELPTSLTFERFAAQVTGIPCQTIFHNYKSGAVVNWRDTGRLKHVYICPKSRLTALQIEEMIVRSELKIGERPALVVVDYIQLMGGKGERRERIAESAESLKTVAKATNTIVIMLSQISRKMRDAGNEVELYDAKEAGEIENSAGLVLGAWRDTVDESLLMIKVLKNTKGPAGKVVSCNFDGERMLITERTIEDEDVPKG